MELMVIPRQVELSSAPWHRIDASLGVGLYVCVCVCFLLLELGSKHCVHVQVRACMCACFTDLMGVCVCVYMCAHSCWVEAFLLIRARDSKCQMTNTHTRTHLFFISGRGPRQQRRETLEVEWGRLPLCA